MFNLIRLELKRGLWNPRWGLIALAALASFWAGWLRKPYPDQGPYSPLDLWMLILNYGFYPYAATLLAALPHADSLLSDRRQGVLRSFCLRRSYLQCLVSKLTANAVCGGLAASMPLVILAVVIHIGVPPLESGQAFTMYQPGFPVDPLTWLFERPYLYIGGLILLAAAFGATCATFGMAVSTWIDNPGWVLASPFVAYALLVYLSGRALSLVWLGDPWAAILPYTRPALGAGIILFQYACALLICLFSLVLFGRKERMLSDTDEGGRQ